MLEKGRNIFPFLEKTQHSTQNLYLSPKKKTTSIMSDNINNNTELPTLQGLVINATDDFHVTPSVPESSKDIVMGDEEGSTSTMSSVSHPSLPVQAPDLNGFSIMLDANYDSDTELASSLEEAITRTSVILSQPLILGSKRTDPLIIKHWMG